MHGGDKRSWGGIGCSPQRALNKARKRQGGEVTDETSCHARWGRARLLHCSDHLQEEAEELDGTGFLLLLYACSTAMGSFWVLVLSTAALKAIILEEEEELDGTARGSNEWVPPQGHPGQRTRSRAFDSGHHRPARRMGGRRVQPIWKVPRTERDPHLVREGCSSASLPPLKQQKQLLPTPRPISLSQLRLEDPPTPTSPRPHFAA
ncbi:hypothetical protein BHM03_00059644 [Ensete ventricosum]|nr:hypothetical protein BHM03_00059644 [Ensete ventricosum]